MFITATRLTQYAVTYGDNILLKCAVIKTPALTSVEWYKSVGDVTSIVFSYIVAVSLIGGG
jgi:hypothetical protein